jgi:hypothetical protein
LKNPLHKNRVAKDYSKRAFTALCVVEVSAHDKRRGERVTIGSNASDSARRVLWTLGGAILNGGHSALGRRRRAGRHCGCCDSWKLVYRPPIRPHKTRRLAHTSTRRIPWDSQPTARSAITRDLLVVGAIGDRSWMRTNRFVGDLLGAEIAVERQSVVRQFEFHAAERCGALAVLGSVLAELKNVSVKPER